MTNYSHDQALCLPQHTHTDTRSVRYSYPLNIRHYGCVSVRSQHAKSQWLQEGFFISTPPQNHQMDVGMWGEIKATWSSVATDGLCGDSLQVRRWQPGGVDSYLHTHRHIPPRVRGHTNVVSKKGGFCRLHSIRFACKWLGINLLQSTWCVSYYYRAFGVQNIRIELPQFKHSTMYYLQVCTA